MLALINLKIIFSIKNNIFFCGLFFLKKKEVKKKIIRIIDMRLKKIQTKLKKIDY